MRIDYAATIEFARRAFYRNELPAQHGGKCRYRPPHGAAYGPCAIGLMLPDDIARKLDSDSMGALSVGAMYSPRHGCEALALELFGTHEESKPFRELQGAHDAWAHSVAERCTYDDIDRARRENCFRKLIGAELLAEPVAE